jgi:hypothetical protein
LIHAAGGSEEIQRKLAAAANREEDKGADLPGLASQPGIAEDDMVSNITALAFIEQNKTCNK